MIRRADPLTTPTMVVTRLLYRSARGSDIRVTAAISSTGNNISDKLKLAMCSKSNDAINSITPLCFDCNTDFELHAHFTTCYTGMI